MFTLIIITLGAMMLGLIFLAALAHVRAQKPTGNPGGHVASPLPYGQAELRREGQGDGFFYGAIVPASRFPIPLGEGQGEGYVFHSTPRDGPSIYREWYCPSLQHHLARRPARQGFIFRVFRLTPCASTSRKKSGFLVTADSHHMLRLTPRHS